MDVLYIGGSGEISQACVLESLRLGHRVTVFNRGRSGALPAGVEHLQGDWHDPDARRCLAERRFDVVCQFIAFTLEDIERDIDTFAGRCRQYVFISSASAYHKPVAHFAPIREDTPLDNPYWEYSRTKAAMEARLADAGDRLPWTVVRPSHTYRARFPVALGDGDWTATRLLAGDPVIVHGDGSALWTLTHAEDFARYFARLLGREAALGEAYHITRDEPHSWLEIFEAMAAALGVTGRWVFIPSTVLVHHVPEWAGPLLGDKTPSTVFDNGKIKRLVGEWPCRVGLAEGMRGVAEAFRRRHGPVDPGVDVDRYEALVRAYAVEV